MEASANWLEGDATPKPAPVEDRKVIPVRTELPQEPKNISSRDIEQIIEDVRAAVSSKVRSDPRTLVIKSRRPPSPTLAYGVRPTLNGRSSNYRPPFHDYSEIARAVDTESFLARSIQKHREYILKEDWEITGKDPETVEYVKERLFHIALATGLSTKEVIRELVTNLITFSSAFIVLKRDVNKSTGRRIRLHGKKLDPIAGIFPMDPVSVKVLQNSAGRPVKWRQEIDGKHRTFSADDVVDITIDRKSGFVFGTPYSITVLDDIRALRRLEELIEMVAHKHLFPMFHVKIGTEKAPAQDIETPSGQIVSEVELARGQIQEVPAEGGLVTSERYTFELIGAEGEVLDLSLYLSHFKSRVMSGLRLSGLDLGEADTGNKATAQVVNRNLVDAVKDFQRVITDQVTMKLFNMFLLEGGFDLTRETQVFFSFPTADREEERSQQQHGLTMYQGNAITCTELRQDYLRKDQFTDDEVKDTFFELQEMEALKRQGEEDRRTQAAAPKPAASSSSGSSSSAKKSKDSNAVKARPRNQFGVSPSKPTFPMNDVMAEWEDLKWSIVDAPESLDVALQLFKGKADSLVKAGLRNAYGDGIQRAKGDLDPSYEVSPIMCPQRVCNSIFSRTIQDSLQKVLASITMMLSSSNRDRATVLSVFDAVSVELRVKTERMCRAAEHIGYLRTANKAGEEQVNLINADGLPVGTLDTDTTPRMVMSHLSDSVCVARKQNETLTDE